MMEGWLRILRATWGKFVFGGENFPDDVRRPGYIDGSNVRFFLGTQEYITVACLLQLLYVLPFVLPQLLPAEIFLGRVSTVPDSQTEHTQSCLPLSPSLVRGPRPSSP
jgi:hypothetical protein